METYASSLYHHDDDGFDSPSRTSSIYRTSSLYSFDMDSLHLMMARESPRSMMTMVAEEDDGREEKRDGVCHRWDGKTMQVVDSTHTIEGEVEVEPEPYVAAKGPAVPTVPHPLAKAFEIEDDAVDTARAAEPSATTFDLPPPPSLPSSPSCSRRHHRPRPPAPRTSLPTRVSPLTLNRPLRRSIRIDIQCESIENQRGLQNLARMEGRMAQLAMGLGVTS
ncbi:hypothetical protein HKX48_001922 [Thoreauomyces humboldtii]|nr:hypothetical protein HKX48_001922 [Thoreauomyces humboldtii]